MAIEKHDHSWFDITQKDDQWGRTFICIHCDEKRFEPFSQYGIDEKIKEANEEQIRR